MHNVSDKRFKSTVGCSVRISSLFMVALGAVTVTTQAFYSDTIALKYRAIPQTRNTNVQAAAAVLSSVPDDS
ncbi:hypothetical protein T4E_5360 [Trichinella pseudospiralis]|uniref:Uncharacterized protein n=1 Tax=Trichinella pseudospiralis TaxID=6337 RepID=A0A0V0Y6D7_TRIPS|nr:hypothetical protein T4E_5360 [Trichinella pseudospiralis]